MTSFTPILNQGLEQGKLMAAVNSLSERLIAYENVKKNGYREFDFSGILKEAFK